MESVTNWLRVEMLRLRSFDWGPGSRRMLRLKDGVMQFNSIYSVATLAANLRLSEDELLSSLDCPSTIAELDDSAFRLSWRGDTIELSWLEAGIDKFVTEINQEYLQMDGKYYHGARWIERIIYLDGTSRTISDTGGGKGRLISEEEFEDARRRIDDPAGDK